jgi:acid phosphatase
MHDRRLRRARRRFSFSMMYKLALPLLGCLLGGCANTSGNTSVQCRALSGAAAPRPAGWGGTIFTIVMENHSRGDILGNSDAPFINLLAQKNAVAAGYHDSYVHPSEPNYIWLVAGENFGILNDNDPGPANHIATQSHLADQIERAGLTWRTYQESMDTPCDLVSHGEYAVKHNPFAYFDDLNGWNGSTLEPTARCREHVVDYSQLALDLAAGKLPDYVFITPNLVDDMHDGSVAAGDAWLARELPPLLASPAFTDGGVLFLLWDEGGGVVPTDDPPFIAISPHAKAGYVSQTPYDGSSYLKTVQTLLGVEPLPCSSTPDAVKVMDDLFVTPLVASVTK